MYDFARTTPGEWRSWQRTCFGSTRSWVRVPPPRPPVRAQASYRCLVLPVEPTETDIEDLVVDALDRLPAPFREQLGSVAIVVEEEASPEQLGAVRARGLYGLYQGVPRTAWSADGAPVPSKITIFRRPLVRANRTPEGLAAAVAETVYHEIAHHLGISDARLHELAAQRRSAG